MAEGREPLLRRLVRWDRALSRLIRMTEQEHHPSRPGFWLAHVGAHLGDSWLWALIATGLWVDVRRRPGDGNQRRNVLLAWLASVATAYLLTMAIKHRTKRRRPARRARLHGHGPDVHSFPSGHASRMGSVVVWANILLPGWGLLSLPLTVWVGWSRIALGIHYLGDVVAGFFLGAGLGALMRRATRRSHRS